MSDGKRAEAAPLDPWRLTCEEPGCGKVFEHPRGRRGNRPKRCPDHRRSVSVERSELAYHRRTRMKGEIERAAAEARDASKLARLAVGLRVERDPELAARLVGVEERGPELVELAARAKREHENLVNGDMRELSRRAEAAVFLMIQEAIERRAEMMPKDLAAFTRVAIDARDAFKGEGPQHNYTKIILEVTPPPASGRLTPEQFAKLRGEEQKESE
jgi:hypothetical protein